MKEDTLIKIVAILSLTVLESINLIFLRIDGSILLAIGAIIGGIAGYEFKKTQVEEKQ